MWWLRNFYDELMNRQVAFFSTHITEKLIKVIHSLLSISVQSSFIRICVIPEEQKLNEKKKQSFFLLITLKTMPKNIMWR